MGFGRKRRVLLRGLTRSMRRVAGLGTRFRIVIGKDGHAIVEAETAAPASNAQLARLSAKLLDALTLEVSDIVLEATSDDACGRVTLKVLQPGTLTGSGIPWPLPAGGRGPDRVH